MNKGQAQKRVRQISAFQEELATLQNDGAIQLTDAEMNGIAAYHAGLLGEFSQKYDTDQSSVEHQLSWGMRIVSALGAIAFSISVFMFFHYYWGIFTTPVQVGLVSVAPFLGWGFSELVARRDKTTHYTSLVVLVAIACFVANLSVVGEIFNIVPSPNAFLAWGLFGLLLAYRHGLTIVLGISLIALIVFAGGAMTSLMGFMWTRAIFPELYLAASLLCIITPLAIKSSAIQRYRYVYFFAGLLCSYFALELLLSAPGYSLFPVEKSTAEWIYAILAFVAATLGMQRCISAQWAAGTYLSATAFVVFMLHKYFEWFWDAFPYYLFFFTLGALAIIAIIVMRNMRIRLRGAHQ